MASHRIIEDCFFLIPLNELGGTGMFGIAKLSAFTEPQPCICSSADCRFCSWMPLNDSLSSFPPRLTNSSKSFVKFHVLGGFWGSTFTKIISSAMACMYWKICSLQLSESPDNITCLKLYTCFLWTSRTSSNSTRLFLIPK
uniref:Uncharacterized protein n=1 Tax=Arundo donax TaxID=35708 RepID=A0A0A8YID5_ARUDO